MLSPVILSGGYGGRLWPVSQTSHPKQFLPLITERTLIQETLMRLEGLPELTEPILICNQAHRFLIAEQIRQLRIEPKKIFLEPVSRNTAPALTIAALQSVRENPDGLLLVLPSDHLISNIPAFHQAVRQAISLAQEEYIVTFGIKPSAPKTGYGYIQAGERIQSDQIQSDQNDRSAFSDSYRIARFVEKPDLQTAQHYIASSGYFWNSGIFLLKSSLYLSILRYQSPEIYGCCLQALEQAHQDKDFCWLDESSFERCPSDSIDYAVMEKTSQSAVIPTDMGWSDVGSWGALWEAVQKDENGNVLQGNIYAKDVNNCYIKSDKEIIVALGTRELIVIDTEKALLVAHMDKEQDVKEAFHQLGMAKSEPLPLTLSSKEGYTPLTSCKG